jgi:hypothetical protein
MSDKTQIYVNVSDEKSQVTVSGDLELFGYFLREVGRGLAPAKSSVVNTSEPKGEPEPAQAAQP